MFAESARQCHPCLPNADHIATGTYDTIDGVLRLTGSPALRFDGYSPLGVTSFVCCGDILTQLTIFLPARLRFPW